MLYGSMACLQLGKLCSLHLPARKFILELEKVPRKALRIIWNGKHLLWKNQLSRLWLLSWGKLSRKIIIGMTMVIRKQLWAVLSATRTADLQMEPDWEQKIKEMVHCASLTWQVKIFVKGLCHRITEHLYDLLLFSKLLVSENVILG